MSKSLENPKTNISLVKGTRIGDYSIYKKLSAGGFSMVYLAYGLDGMPVAIKEYFPGYLHLRQRGTQINFINMREKHKFQEGLKLFKHEMEIIMRLKHRNIIEIVDFIEQNGTAYILMPYEYGMTLSRFISQDDLTEQEIIPVVMGIFSAVHTFHQNGIIHLDIKPGNIWLRPDKEALILDFGTARTEEDSAKTKSAPMHTPGYAAPEQHKQYFAPDRIGFWCDYYALGATLYALIEKQAPKPSCDIMDAGAKINFIYRRRGQVSMHLLEIAEELMTLEWDERKKIDLGEVINRIGKIRPITPMHTMVENLMPIRVPKIKE